MGAWLWVALALPFAAMLLAPLTERRWRGSGAWVAAGAGAAAFSILLLLWARGPVTVSVPWVPTLGVAFVLRLDTLGFLFGSLVTGVGALILGYAATYMAPEGGTPRFYGYLSLFMGSMLGLVLAGDLVLLFVFWELTTVSSFLLIGFRRGETRAVAAALKALIITGLGGLALLVAVLLLWGLVGSFDVAAILGARGLLQASPLLLPILLLVAIAAAAKSAQFPLHIWLPDAMVAPTPVSAYLHSAAMVKAGVYLLARLLPALGSVEWTALLLPLGLGTMLLGGVLALRAVDLKRILAYSTISQLGLLVSAFGLATPSGTEAGLLHFVNHVVMKASLFLVAGGITVATGIADIRGLGGLRARMPLTAVACGLAAFSMAGIPPLGGFLSKEVYFDALLHQGLGWTALAVVGGALTFAYSLHFFGRLFLGETRGAGSRESLGLAIPALGLAGFTVVFGLLPSLLPIGGAPSLFTLTPESLLLSGASIALGLLILLRYAPVARLVERGVTGLRGLTVDGAYEGLQGMSRRLGRGLGFLVQNGSVRRYTGVLILFVLLALLSPLAVPSLTLPVLANPRDVAILAVLLAMIVFAALAAVLRDLLHAILSLSGMGFLLAMAFMFLNAPDLAMTQILVELVFLAIFLIVLYRIPFRAIRPSRPRTAVDLLLGIGMVVGVASLVSLSLGVFLVPSIAELYFLVPAEEAGGHNLVNLIVTNFRAFDTLGEITVIALASIAVYTLLRRWGR